MWAWKEFINLFNLFVDSCTVVLVSVQEQLCFQLKHEKSLKESELFDKKQIFQSPRMKAGEGCSIRLTSQIGTRPLGAQGTWTEGLKMTLENHLHTKPQRV